jgi:acetyl esterase/lipase
MSSKSEEVLEWPSPPADERIRYGDQPPQFADLRLPAGAGPHPLLVVLHGGYWRARYDLEHMSHLCSAYAKRGIATLNVEYRRVGDIGGGWPGTFEDVVAAIELARKLGRTHSHLRGAPGVLGFSAGGHLALWVASRHRLLPDDPFAIPAPCVHYAVSLAGVTNLGAAWEGRLSEGAVKDLLGGTPSSHPERYLSSPHDLASWRPRQGVPGIDVIVVHGKADEHVPYWHAESYADLAKRRGDRVTMIDPDDVGHFDLIDPRTDVFESVLSLVIPLSQAPSMDDERALTPARMPTFT